MTVPTSPFWTHEVALTRHYLGTDGPEGSLPLAFLDASGRQIARALGRPDEDAEAALETFIRIFTPARIVVALRDGHVAPAPAGLPVMGWFSYLVLTCHVASVSPNVAASDRFRDRLQLRLGLDRGISELSGIARLWERAQRWCEFRHRNGQPIRQIALPDPGTATQIGHSLRISFPARSDLRRMERLFGGLATGRPPAPGRVVATVRSEIADRTWSQGFLRAFDEFSTRFRAGDRLLEDHPFWVAIRGLSERPASRTDPHTFDVEFHAGFDGSPSYSIRTDDPEVLRALSVEPDQEPGRPAIELDLPDLLSLLGGDVRSVPHALRRCHAEGAIPFTEVSWGVWRAERTPEGANVRLLLRADAARRTAVTIEGNYAWGLGPPVSREGADALLAALRGHGPDRSELVGVRIRGGVRMDDAYLGRPKFLPQATVGPGCAATISAVGTTVGTIDVSLADGVVSLDCSNPLEGVWRLEVSERGVVRARPSLIFEPDARLDARRSADELAADWRPEEPTPVGCSPVPVARVIHERVENRFDDALADLLEALYATGAGGWAERDVVGIVGTCLPDRFAGWDVLRLLVDSGWLVARVSKRWRARRWYLVPPYLTVFPSTGVVVLEGAAAAGWKRKFRDVAEATSATVEMRSVEADWSIPTLSAQTTDPKALAMAVGLPLVEAAASLPPIEAPLRYDDTLYGDERRIVGSTWDWARGRFTRHGDGKRFDVVLERLATARLGAADIYRIVADGSIVQLLDGRNAAIVLAHRTAGIPLFTFDGREKRLTRLAGEGALPSAVARYLRLRNGCGPGLDFGVDGRGYVAKCEPTDAMSLKAWLGPALNWVGGGPSPLDRTLLTLALGRSRGPGGARAVAGVAARS
ncbi:hypothetical protein [Methylobacterium pseudosasicola]|uniref:Uncharacterized protein n=1 Tax=Methylobacterium pseudosasicola TaxID=582667 RepID=A0A1I4HW54_9HYPH|nr:hypothetical protein [Methylobacterium pseudosasicola]SFL45871.1 hypothetical protein SAMN05192568_100569 [Methylobacterium pseudosasicola]